MTSDERKNPFRVGQTSGSKRKCKRIIHDLKENSSSMAAIPPLIDKHYIKSAPLKQVTRQMLF
jgi:hypothetical protein